MRAQVPTSERVEVVDVTDKVAGAIPDDADGTVTVFVPHTTAGVTINESESGLLADLEHTLERLVPEDGGYAHDRLDGNADAHLRAMLLGSDVTVPVENGILDLGTWQSILFVEGDGPRTRELQIVVE